MTAPQAYLALLRAALWENPGSSSGMTEALQAVQEQQELLNELLAIANRQKTRALIYNLLIQNGIPIPEETASQMQQLLLKIANTHRMLDTAVARSVKTLQAAGIPAVLLKGQGVARYYPNPWLRECGDVDLYIGPERLQEAVRSLSPLADRTADEIHGKHWQLWIGAAEIELHEHTMLPETRRHTILYREFETEGLHEALVPVDFSGVSVPTPEDTFNAFYLFYHAWHHFCIGGIGFRQLCDWTLLLHARKAHIDRTRLRGILEGMQLLGPWRLFGCVAVRDLGLPQEEFPFYDDSRPAAYRRILSLILSEGNFGRGHKALLQRPKNYFGGKVYSFFGHIGRFFRLLPFSPRAAFSVLRSLTVGGIKQVFKDLFHR